MRNRLILMPLAVIAFSFLYHAESTGGELPLYDCRSRPDRPVGTIHLKTGKGDDVELLVPVGQYGADNAVSDVTGCMMQNRLISLRQRAAYNRAELLCRKKIHDNKVIYVKGQVKQLTTSEPEDFLTCLQVQFDLLGTKTMDHTGIDAE